MSGRTSATCGSRPLPRPASPSSTASWLPAAAGTAPACPLAPSSTSTPCCVGHSATPSSSTRSCRPTPSNGPNGPARPDPSRGAYGPPSNSGPSSTPPVSTGCSPSTASPRTPAPGRGELLNLRWHDIDLDHGEVRITGSAAVIAGQRIEGTTKSGRSRTVSIDPGTVQVLRDHRKRQADERLKVGPEWCGTDDYVFSTAWGKPIHPDTV